jgi:hypothetical protein
MKNTTVRFIEPDEVNDLVREMFSIDRTLIREPITEGHLEYMIKYWTQYMKEGIFKISMVFDENNSPIGMYTGRLLPGLGGWCVGSTKIKNPQVNYYVSARIMAPALELMLSYMEGIGYYKFWMTAPEKHHNIRNKVIRKVCPMMERYGWVDEAIIPKNEKSEAELYEMHRRICTWSDVVVRQFYLKQEHRIQLLRKLNSKDYRGTLITDLE